LDAATCAAVLPLPYFFDESAFEEAWIVAAAEPPVPPDAVQVFAFWYVHVVLFFVSFAGFIPGVVADAFVPALALAEPETCAWLCVWTDAVAACFSWPGAVAELPLPESARAVALKAAAASAHTDAAARRAKGPLIVSLLISLLPMSWRPLRGVAPSTVYKFKEIRVE